MDIRKKDETTGVTQRLVRLLAAVETLNGYPLFKNTSSATGVAATSLEQFSAWCLPLVSDERKIHFEGNAAALCMIDVLEFDA